MAIQIKLKNSVVQDSTPSTSDLPAVGEIALNANINSIGGFMRASDNSIVKIFGPGSLSTPTATTTVSGISELATNSETTTGTATNRVVTPAGLNAVTVAERTTSNTNYVAKAGSTLTGVLTMPNGSNSAPAINFGDSDSGIFGGTNTVSLAAGGTTRLTADTGVSVVGTLAVTGAITSTSDLTIADKIIHAGDTDTAIRFPAADTVSLETAGSERLRVDSQGRFLIGTSTARSPGGIVASFEIEGTNVDTSSLSATRNSADNAGPNFVFNKTRGAAVGADVIVNANDQLGRIKFCGNDGTDSDNTAAAIDVFVDGTPGSNDMPGRLVFSTTADGAVSPTERLRIDSNGRVGIGTTNQSNAEQGGGLKIDKYIERNAHYASPDGYYGASLGKVNNSETKVWASLDSQFSQSSAVSAGLFLSSFHGAADGSGCGSTIKNLKTGNAFVFSTVTTGSSVGSVAVETERMRIDSSGRLGVGLTNPAGKICANSENNTATFLASGEIDNPSYPAYGFGGQNADNGSRGAGMYLPSDGILAFATHGSERIRIREDGKVGIGTTSPTGALHVAGSGEDGGIRLIDSSTSGGSPNFEIIGKRQDGNNNTAFAANVYLAGHRTDAKVSNNKILGTINFGGNHTDGSESNISYAASIRGVASDSFDSKSDMPTDLTFNTGVQGRNRTGELAGQSNPGTERVRITSDGKIGINTASPSQALHVVGNILASGTITPNSDIAFKKDIEPLTNVLNKITQLIGVNFKYKDNNQKSMGLLAQDVEKVFPELIQGEEGEKSLNYMGLAGAIVEAIKELAAKVTKLEGS